MDENFQYQELLNQDLSNDFHYFNLINILIDKNENHLLIKLLPQHTAQQQRTFLELAIRKNKTQLIEQALDLSINIYDPPKKEYLQLNFTEKEQFLISYAAAYGNPEIIDLLVNKGMKIKSNKEHAFGWACSNNNLKNVRHIYEKYGANLSNIHITEETSLSWAIDCENIKVIEYLLSVGANLNQDEKALKSLFIKTNIALIIVATDYLNEENILSFKHQREFMLGNKEKKIQDDEIVKILMKCLLDKTLTKNSTIYHANKL